MILIWPMLMVASIWLLFKKKTIIDLALCFLFISVYIYDPSTLTPHSFPVA